MIQVTAEQSVICQAATMKGYRLTPNEGNPGYRLGQLQSDFPNIAFFIPAPDSKDLRDVAFDKIGSVFASSFLFLLSAHYVQRMSCGVQTLLSWDTRGQRFVWDT